LITTFTSYPTDFGRILILIRGICLVGYVIAGVVFLCMGIGFIRLKDWRATLSCVPMPLFVVWICVWPCAVSSLSPDDYAHILAFRIFYQAEVDAVNDTEKTRLISFYWRDASSPLDSHFIYLVFDESDEFALPISKRSSAWRSRANGLFGKQMLYGAPTEGCGRVRRLFSHWYVVDLESM
jgi:hypothetical protein